MVYEGVRDRLDLTFEDMGEQQVKNIARPIRVWRWVTDSSAAATGPAKTDAPLSLPDKPSIAVLPFDNLSGDPEQVYFCDGIAEDLITGLARISELVVIARNSSFSFRGQPVTVQQIGRELGTSHVLEGSVRKVENRVRVTAQLIDATNGHHLWADRYDRELGDIFALQDELTSAIVSALKIKLSAAPSIVEPGHSTNNMDAYDWFLKGRQIGTVGGPSAFQESEACFWRAVALDPDYAGAYAGIAVILAAQAIAGPAGSVGDVLAQARSCAERAMALNDRDPVVHGCQVLVLCLSGRHGQAIAAAERSLSLSPNYVTGHRFALYAYLASVRP
jgi:adenylate cyclase